MRKCKKEHEFPWMRQGFLPNKDQSKPSGHWRLSTLVVYMYGLIRIYWLRYKTRILPYLLYMSTPLESTFGILSSLEYWPSFEYPVLCGPWSYTSNTLAHSDTGCVAFVSRLWWFWETQFCYQENSERKRHTVACIHLTSDTDSWQLPVHMRPQPTDVSPKQTWWWQWKHLTSRAMKKLSFIIQWWKKL